MRAKCVAIRCSIIDDLNPSSLVVDCSRSELQTSIMAAAVLTVAAGEISIREAPAAALTDL